jgi:hypothetical protein
MSNFMASVNESIRNICPTMARSLRNEALRLGMP